MRIHDNQRANAILAIVFGLIMMTAGCGIVGVACGDLGALLCGSGLYCTYEDGSCGRDGEVGVCALKPEACALVFAPVCGCDGKT